MLNNPDFTFVFRTCKLQEIKHSQHSFRIGPQGDSRSTGCCRITIIDTSIVTPSSKRAKNQLTISSSSSSTNNIATKRSRKKTSLLSSPPITEVEIELAPPTIQSSPITESHRRRAEARGYLRRVAGKWIQLNPKGGTLVTLYLDFFSSEDSVRCHHSPRVVFVPKKRAVLYADGLFDVLLVIEFFFG